VIKEILAKTPPQTFFFSPIMELFYHQFFSQNSPILKTSLIPISKLSALGYIVCYFLEWVMARYGTALRCATVQSRAASLHIITNMYANHLLLWKRHLDNYFLTSATKLL